MSAKAGTTWVLCEVMASRRAEAGYASGVVLAWRHGPRAHAAPTDSGAYSCAGAGIGVRTKHDSCTEAAQARIRISTRDRHARAHERDLRRYVQSRIDLLTLAGGFSLRCATRWVAFGPLLSVPSPTHCAHVQRSRTHRRRFIFGMWALHFGQKANSASLRIPHANVRIRCGATSPGILEETSGNAVSGLLARSAQRGPFSPTLGRSCE